MTKTQMNGMPETVRVVLQWVIALSAATALQGCAVVAVADAAVTVVATGVKTAAKAVGAAANAVIP